MTDSATLILSGGMDSTVLAYHLAEQGVRVRALTFDYNQRHNREINSAEAVAKRLGIPHEICRLPDFGFLVHGSALTDPSVDVPHGHYAAPSMKQTVVHARNAVMLSIAWGVACANGDNFVCAAVHAGDHAIYADCRLDFIQALNHALSLGTGITGGHGPDKPRGPALKLYTPFIRMSKTDIAYLGGRLNVPFSLTWTCYEGGKVHCGRCGACVERKEAFRESGVYDPTRYAA